MSQSPFDSTASSILNRTLPMVTYVRDLYKNLNFNSVLVIAAQHLYSTTYTMFQALLSLGLKTENLHVMGKCYSTDPRVFAQLLAEGINVSPDSLKFDSHVAYDDDFQNSLELFLMSILEKVDLYQFEKIIILDDGGDLIYLANKLMPKDLKLIAVEQTSSGFNRLNNKTISFPIVNMARSWIKLEHETPIIIDLAEKKILDKISQLSIQPRKVLITGNGVIGQHIASSLLTKSTYNVEIYDTKAQKNTFNSLSLKNSLSQFDLIIGCSGETSIKADYHAYLKPDTVLASISSSDREFDAIHLRRHLPKFQKCHKNSIFNGIHLLNSGFPVNFDSDFESIDTDKFQLTRSIILASICQAFNEQDLSPRWIPVDDSTQHRLLSLFKIIYG